MRGPSCRLVVAFAAVAASAAVPPAVAGQGPTPATGPAGARRVADYDIAVRLDPDSKRLDGTLRLTWRNPSADAVPDLWFHLYLNAFRDRESTFWRESRGQLRGVETSADGWGSIDVTALRIAGGADLLPALTFEAPDDGNRRDRTLARVRLPQPIAPGGSVALDIAFRAVLPAAYARTGHAGDYFLVGQWFPKIAVYEPAGVRGRTAGGWSAHQFHADSEFYADFGHYRVAITLPKRFVVGATGVRTARVDHADGRSTHTYEQGDVHDFAWTASPRFVEITRRFDAGQVSRQAYREAAARLGRSVDELRLGDVEIRLLMQPNHLPQAERYLRAVTAAIERFGLAYGRYPYPTLTIVDPPESALGTAGMEYPTFITAGTITLFNTWPFDRIFEPEIVVAHEFAHQYFQGIIASNEFEEAWLDEGLTEWATGGLLDEMLGPRRSFTELAGLRIGDLDYQRFGLSRRRSAEMIRQPSWTYDTGYAFNSYARPALMLRTLERLIGSQAMARVMRTYAERWRFGHPSSDDFYRVASDVAGRDLTPFFRQTIESPAVIDYAVGAITQEDGYAAVTVRRDGDLQMPVVVAFKFAGRPVERRTWDGVARWTRFTFAYAEPLEWVDVDPDRDVALDVSWLNNGRTVAADRRAPVAMTSRWLLAVQQILGWLAF